MRKLLPWVLLLAGCGSPPPEIAAKTEEIQSLRNQRRQAIESVRELPGLQRRRQELIQEKADLLLRQQKAGQK